MCSRECSRIVLIIFNILFFFAGAILFGFGLAGLINPGGLQKSLGAIPGVNDVGDIVDIPGLITNCALFMTILGVVLFIFGFLGCGGALWVNKCLLFTYWVALILIILAEIALIVVAAHNPSKTEDIIKSKTYMQLEKKFQPVAIYRTVTLPSQPFSISWVGMQFKVGCCGVYNYTDFGRFMWNNTFLLPTPSGHNQTIVARVPPSCCLLKDKSNVPQGSESFVNVEKCFDGQEAFINQNGCYEAIAMVFKKYYYVPIIVCVIIIILQVIAVGCALYLWRLKEGSMKE